MVLTVTAPATRHRVKVVPEVPPPEYGSLMVCGANDGGQLGLGDTDSRSALTHLGGFDWVRAQVGRRVATAAKRDGSLWVWGLNSVGELGLGDTEDRSFPVQLGGAEDWEGAILSAQGQSVAAIRGDGTLWVWGSNSRGTLGLGDAADRSTPTQVGGVWRRVSVGHGTTGGHTLAVRDDGTLWAWGRNQDGKLGLGDTVDRSTPTQVGTDGGWVEVATGTNHTLAIKSDGSLWTWGANYYGQLGNGRSFSTPRSSPVRVGDDEVWGSVSAGSEVSYGLSHEGRLYAWGRNLNGQLGMGDTTSRSTPVQVGSSAQWDTIHAGYAHLAAKTQGHTIYVTGRNTDGRLGLGDTEDRSTLTQMGRAGAWVGAGISGGYSTFAVERIVE